ncbi:hypothetical protein [Deinococcus ruber]|uniref:Uncharacterized protein n=1 Tax=Deinococcus ruber TaxID=1848197 RepID=A0A918C281_9DEIO|nr:hypothetical protein [Deinococcus ruber]GGR03405.1 hypothetical protein GCM10008957_15350 [Deinococcus ruber]
MPYAPDPTPLTHEAVKIVAYQGNLYTETGLPLYRYFPLAEMSRLQQTVPWASEWDPYIRGWIETYMPLPRTTSDTPAIRRGGLSYQDRTGAAPGRDYQQAVYRGWPLYTSDLDTPGFQIPPQGTVPGLFEMVSVAEPPVVWPSPEAGEEGGGVGWPDHLDGP